MLQSMPPTQALVKLLVQKIHVLEFTVLEIHTFFFTHLIIRYKRKQRPEEDMAYASAGSIIFKVIFPILKNPYSFFFIGIGEWVGAPA